MVIVGRRVIQERLVHCVDGLANPSLPIARPGLKPGTIACKAAIIGAATLPLHCHYRLRHGLLFGTRSKMVNSTGRTIK